MTKTILTIFLLTILTSCKESENLNSNFYCKYNLSQLKKSLSNDELQKIKIIDTFSVFDERINGKVGGVYTFNKSQKLIDYRFFDDSNSYIYNEKYENNSFASQGSPIVRYELNNDNNGNSNLYIDFFLLNKKIETLKLSLNGEEIIPKIEKSVSFKNTFFTATHLKKVKSQDLSKNLLVIKLKLIECNGDSNYIVDTISNYTR